MGWIGTFYRYVCPPNSLQLEFPIPCLNTIHHPSHPLINFPCYDICIILILNHLSGDSSILMFYTNPSCHTQKSYPQQSLFPMDSFYYDNLVSATGDYTNFMHPVSSEVETVAPPFCILFESMLSTTILLLFLIEIYYRVLHGWFTVFLSGANKQTKKKMEVTELQSHYCFLRGWP
jgi:hypothetical protein